MGWYHETYHFLLNRKNTIIHETIFLHWENCSAPYSMGHGPSATLGRLGYILEYDFTLQYPISQEAFNPKSRYKRSIHMPWHWQVRWRIAKTWRYGCSLFQIYPKSLYLGQSFLCNNISPKVFASATRLTRGP